MTKKNVGHKDVVIVVSVPRSLRVLLEEEAEKEGVSLELWCLTRLSLPPDLLFKHNTVGTFNQPK